MRRQPHGRGGQGREQLLLVVENTIGWFEGPQSGYWDVANNAFLNCTGAQPTTSTGQLKPPFAYVVDDPNGLPTSIVAGAGVGKM